jgi:septal ring-binding cell division protein DamX
VRPSRITGLALLSSCIVLSGAVAISAKDNPLTCRPDGLYQPFSEQDASQSYVLGQRFEFGQAGPVDPIRAYQWYCNAAMQGHEQAEFKVALMLLEGQGAKQDITTGVRWLNRSASKGNHDAELSLGILLEDTDARSSAKLFERAAAGGNLYANHRLAELYYYGLGVERDYQRSLKLAEYGAQAGFEKSRELITRIRIKQETAAEAERVSAVQSVETSSAVLSAEPEVVVSEPDAVLDVSASEQPKESLAVDEVEPVIVESVIAESVELTDDQAESSSVDPQVALDTSNDKETDNKETDNKETDDKVIAVEEASVEEVKLEPTLESDSNVAQVVDPAASADDQSDKSNAIIVAEEEGLARSESDQKNIEEQVEHEHIKEEPGFFASLFGAFSSESDSEAVDENLPFEPESSNNVNVADVQSTDAQEPSDDQVGVALESNQPGILDAPSSEVMEAQVGEDNSLPDNSSVAEASSIQAASDMQESVVAIDASVTSSLDVESEAKARLSDEVGLGAKSASLNRLNDVKKYQRSAEWINSQPNMRYAIQLVQASQPDGMMQFIQEHQIQENAYFIHVEQDGNQKYVLLYGDYPNNRTSKSVAKTLPKAVQDNGYWIRTFGDLRRSYKVDP